MDGQPFFLVNKAVDPGLIDVLREDIIPRLLRDVPGQPSEQQLNDDPTLHRFTMVFDREGYSPAFIGAASRRGLDDSNSKGVFDVAIDARPTGRPVFRGEEDGDKGPQASVVFIGEKKPTTVHDESRHEEQSR